MFGWQVLLTWWLMAGTALALVMGIPGMLIYLTGVVSIVWVTGFTLITKLQLVQAVELGIAAGLLALLFDRVFAYRWPVQRRTGEIIVGSALGGLLLGMLFGPGKGLLALGAGSGLPFWALYRRYGLGHLLAGSLGWLIRLSGVLIINGILMWRMLGK